MLDHPLDNLGVTLAEGGHEAGHLPVVLRVDVCTGRVEELDDLEVSAVGSEPEAGVALLVAHINLSGKIVDC